MAKHNDERPNRLRPRRSKVNPNDDLLRAVVTTFIAGGWWRRNIRGGSLLKSQLA